MSDTQQRLPLDDEADDTDDGPLPWWVPEEVTDTKGYV